MTTQSKEMTVQEKQAIDARTGEPTQAGSWFRPTVDIYETDQSITVKADLPGVTNDGLDIDLRDDVLTITGSVKPVAEKLREIYREYEVGGFTRQFRLGETIDQTKISAKLDEGVLTLELPKAEKAKPRKIAIRT